MKATFRIIVTIPYDELRKPHPFGISEALDSGIADLHNDPTDPEGGRALVVEWPIPHPITVCSFQKFMKQYAGPLLAAGGHLYVGIHDDTVKAGLNADAGIDPVAWIHIDREKLDGGVHAKLAAVRKVLDS